MKTSKFFITTLKEVPAEAELVSHRLMLRAGIIRRLSAGIYTWLPLGMRVLQKVEAIVREEMNRAGAVELSMPVVQPAELWQESGRWQAYGPELLRFKDRHERDFVIQPTSEEAITELARAELKSYRRLPVHFYQIQTKFRDERRPRFGIMRGREFVMKDGYSFHADYASLEREYRNMHDTYTRIFTRLGLKFRAGGRRHRRHRRHRLARVPRARRLRRGRDRLLAAVGLRGERGAGGGDRRLETNRSLGKHEEGRHAGQGHLRGRRRAAQAAARKNREVDRGDARRALSTCCWCAAITR